MSSYIVVIMTVPNREEATKIVRSLLEQKLISCANIVGPVSSIFWWKRTIVEANEFLVLMKSHRNLFKKLSERVMKLHSYEVPEILALPVAKGSLPYLNWLKASLSD